MANSNFPYGKEAHEKRIKAIAAESIRNQIAEPPLLSLIKVGQIVFLKERIAEGPNDHSPGGIFGYRGDAVMVKSIRAYQHIDGWKYDKERNYCEINWSYGVYHLDVTDGTAFTVYRNEIMPTDPLLTVEEQREYCRTRGRYKTLESRFKKGKPYVNSCLQQPK